MKINVTEHERALIVYALREVGGLIGLSLATKINTQDIDTASDGPEVEILSVDGAGWGS